jgi:Zn-dependent M32 family carboxypeptidase
VPSGGFYLILQATFHHQLRAVEMEQFYAVINRVKPSLIRVEADELTNTSTSCCGSRSSRT